ncbi:hypothetical protein KPL39_18750, partial [Clostridium gasigenes]|uniref:cohesin domain-containing protein n=1 Tax=Clostridium gasigenes TaxID=94869 RepID=UPI001DF4E152
MKLKIKLKLKTLSIMLCFSMLFQLLGTSFVITNAATIEPAKVSYTINGEAKIGNTIDIAVNISNITNFFGGSVDFAYDTSLLEVQSITKGDIFGINKVSEPVKSVSNGLASIGLTLTGTNPGVSTNGTLAIIKAKVLKEGTINIKTTPLNVLISPIAFNSRVKLSDNNGNFITYTAEDKVINLNSSIPISISSISTDKVSPQAINSTIRISPKASGNGALSYKFWVNEGSGWKVVQDYSSKNYYDWSPTKQGSFKLWVDVKDSTGTAVYKEIPYVINNKIGISSISTDKVSPQAVNSTIRISPKASGNGALSYKFWVNEGSGWKVVQDYSSKNY